MLLLRFVILRFVIFPDWESLVQYWQVLGLLQPLVVVVLGCGIFALTSMSFNEGGFLYVTIKSWMDSSLVAH